MGRPRPSDVSRGGGQCSDGETEARTGFMPITQLGKLRHKVVICVPITQIGKLRHKLLIHPLYNQVN